MPRLLTALFASLIFTGIAMADDTPQIGADALLQRQAAADPALVVLDVRTPQEFAEGHVPGAINIPHDQVETRLAELAGARDKDLVVYCRSGRRAALAEETLRKNGFTRLQHLEGDMAAWAAANRPTEKAAAAN